MPVANVIVQHKSLPAIRRHPSNRGDRRVCSFVLADSKAAEVPVLSQTIRRDRIVEIPEIHVRQKIVPKIHVKEIVKTVPKVEVQ